MRSLLHTESISNSAQVAGVGLQCLSKRERQRHNREHAMSLKLLISGLLATTPVTVAVAQIPPPGSYYFVANTRPPDAFLALRTLPSATYGQRIEIMPNGTPLSVLQQGSDGWWHVRNVSTGHEGWALQGQGATSWIVCCTSVNPVGSTDEGDFQVSHGVSDGYLAMRSGPGVGHVTFNFQFIDPKAENDTTRSVTVMMLDQLQLTQDALFKLYKLSETAHAKKIRADYAKRVI